MHRRRVHIQFAGMLRGVHTVLQVTQKSLAVLLRHAAVLDILHRPAQHIAGTLKGALLSQRARLCATSMRAREAYRAGGRRLARAQNGSTEVGSVADHGAETGMPFALHPPR